MSIFGDIVSAVFGSAHTTGASRVEGSQSASAGAPPTASAAGAQPMSEADVEAVIAKLPGAEGEEHDWKHSIVDLLKLLDLDSSLDARRRLARELGYTGKLDGSAEMNEWLHARVMAELAKHGGHWEK